MCRRQAVGYGVAVGVAAVGVGVGTRVAASARSVAESADGEGLGVALRLGHVLPGGTWQSPGATIRGSSEATRTSESATCTSDAMSPLLTGPARVIAAPPVVHPITAYAPSLLKTNPSIPFTMIGVAATGVALAKPPASES